MDREAFEQAWSRWPSRLIGSSCRTASTSWLIDIPADNREPLQVRYRLSEHASTRLSERSLLSLDALLELLDRFAYVRIARSLSRRAREKARFVVATSGMAFADLKDLGHIAPDDYCDHLLIWSEADQRALTVVVDRKSLEVVTVLDAEGGDSEAWADKVNSETIRVARLKATRRSAGSMQGNPAIADLAVGSSLSAFVVKTFNNRARLKLPDGSSAMLHIADVFNRRSDLTMHDVVTPAEVLEVVLLGFHRVDLYAAHYIVGLPQGEEGSAWGRIADSYKAGMLTTVTISAIATSGLRVDLDDLGFAHIDKSEVAWFDPDGMIDGFQLGQRIPVVITEIQANRRKVFASHRRAIANPWPDLAARFPIGTVIAGRVGKILEYGAIVRIPNGPSALLHNSELSWVDESDARSMFVLGEEVTAVVSAIDVERSRMDLSLRSTRPDPWLEIERLAPIGSRAVGAVVKVLDFGAVIRLPAGYRGLLHVDQLGGQAMPVMGDEVEVSVIGFDTESRRLSFSLSPRVQL